MKYNIDDYTVKLDELGKIIIYLRKSREDLIDGRYATDEETLSRHEEQLQQWARNNLGYEIPPENIYKEIGSGEKIKSRPVFQEVLRQLENDKDIDGLLAVNCSRLSRGDLIDCGNLINILEVTDTLVLTPPKIYNLKNKYDKRFFKDELLRGNDYLEQAKELLANGRHWSTSVGKWVHNTAPYGYDRVTCREMKIADEKGFTLRPNDNAEYVQVIFEMYADGAGRRKIARHLNSIGAPHDKEWDHCDISRMLTNLAYNGYLTWGKRRNRKEIINGEVIEKRKKDDKCPVYKGLHTPIINNDLWRRVQNRLKKNDTPLRSNLETKNSLAGVIKCAKCDRAMIRHAFTDTTKKRKYNLDKSALQTLMETHRKRLKLSKVEISKRLNVKPHIIYQWFGKVEKFYPAETFVNKWYDLKNLLQIETTEFDAAITEFVEVQKSPVLSCSNMYCDNVQAYLDIIEKKLLDIVKAKFENYRYYLDNYEEEITRTLTANKKAISNFDKQISMKEKQLKNAKIAFEQGADTLQEYIDRKKELLQEIDDLTEKKNALSSTEEGEKTETIKKAVPILRNVFESYYTLDPSERNALLKSVIDYATYSRSQANDGGASIDISVCWLV